MIVRVAVRDFVCWVAPRSRVLVFVVRCLMFCCFGERIDVVARALFDVAAMVPRIVFVGFSDIERSAAWHMPIAVINDRDKNRKTFFLIHKNVIKNFVGWAIKKCTKWCILCMIYFLNLLRFLMRYYFFLQM